MGSNTSQVRDALNITIPRLKAENIALRAALKNLVSVAEKQTSNLIAWDGADPLDKAIDIAKDALNLKPTKI